MFPSRDSWPAKVALAIFFVLLVGYAYYEARAMLYGPRIIIAAETLATREPLAVIEGRAENITELRMNGAPISVTEDGVFKEPIILTPGGNLIVLDATDRYGRVRQKTIEAIYSPQDAPPPMPAPRATSTDAVAPKD